MANTTLHGNGVVQITGLDADWRWDTDGGFDTEVGMKVTAIQFCPSASNDVMIVHDKSIDAVPLLDSNPTGTAPVQNKFPGGKWCKPVIDISDCTLDTAANAKVIIYYD